MKHVILLGPLKNIPGELDYDEAIEFNKVYAPLTIFKKQIIKEYKKQFNDPHVSNDIAFFIQVNDRFKDVTDLHDNWFGIYQHEAQYFKEINDE